jgi:alkanesulfonate monooxygenase SsuD/methylene tetrahydromethanopterin reductase-like flavin-dependent oxidoreductase (luciferase family)
VLISDDTAAARDAMRPMLSLYVGGMGSREQNFYNRLVSSYGFEAAARQVQDHYLAGKRSDAAMALPDELIDMVTIAGSPERARARIRAFRDAGIDTLIVSPMTLDAEESTRQLRLVAELNQELS